MMCVAECRVYLKDLGREVAVRYSVFNSRCSTCACSLRLCVCLTFGVSVCVLCVCMLEYLCVRGSYMFACSVAALGWCFCL